MIFLRYESFRGYLRSYPGTSVLVLLNIIYFIVIAAKGDPSNVLHALRMGAFVSDPVYDPFGVEQPWRYIVSQFMHADFSHLFFNMFALIVFVPPLEYLLKTVRFVPFYLLCGIGGNLLSAIMDMGFGDGDLNIGVGASGAIYGAYGAYLFIALFRKSMMDSGSRKTIYILLLFGILYSIMMVRVSLWGHVGGLLTGFVLYKLFESAHLWRRQRP